MLVTEADAHLHDRHPIGLEVLSASRGHSRSLDGSQTECV